MVSFTSLTFRGFGFQNYMTDLFDAPKTVLQYLCENYRLHDIPIGNSETERHSNEVCHSETYLDQLRFSYGV